MKTRTLALSLFVLVAAVAVGYAWFGAGNGTAKAPGKAGPVPVRIGQARTADVPMQLRLVGRGEAFETVALRARVDGQVRAVVYAEGQHAKAGDVLVKLDPADMEARLRQAQANLARGDALLVKARNDVDRYLSLMERGFVSGEKVAEVRAAAAAAEATVGADRAAVDLARLQLGYATVRAPIAGVVGARLVFPGTAVKTNDTVLAVLNRVRPLNVAFTVPEKHLPAVRAALAKGALKVSVSAPGGTGAVEGQARFLDNAVDPTTGTIQMKAQLPNEDERLTPGQFLEVGLTLETLHDAVLVPQEAIFQGARGASVFVVEAGNKVALRSVEVTARQDGVAVIAKGVAAGETVVTDGQLRLSPGATVDAVDAPAANAGAGTKFRD